ncbi:MAG: hypothetical protein K8S99_07145 [Planctomycetes bacterium]|nr:hypothetical protein [Planctomycetota bacterium]
MKTRPSITRFIGISLLCLSACVSQAHGQVSNLDPTMLIEGLRKEGMGELLKHLITKLQADPKSDPVVLKHVLINQHLLDYSQKWARAAKLPDAAAIEALRKEARADFDQSLTDRRDLIAKYPKHDLRPLWQTDLAEQLFDDYLRKINQNAAEFYELGVPTAEQREAFEKSAVEMFEQLSDADRRFFDLIGEMPRRPDHVARVINTGMWDRITKQYNELRTPYFLAYGAFYVALLPDSNPYYRNLGKNSVIPAAVQGKTPTEERARLLGIAVEKLQKFLDDKNDMNNVLRPSQSLAGRAKLQQGKINEATDLLDPIINANTTDLVDLVSRVARGYAYEKAGQPDQALAALTAAQTQGLARQELPFRLLVVDATHLLLLSRAMAQPADKRAQGLTTAYEPYQQLFADPALGAALPIVKAYVFKRWESSIPPGRDLKDEPALVVAAIGETSEQAGQEMAMRAGDLANAGNTAEAEKLTKEAHVKLERSVKVNTDLLARPNLSNSIKAQAMFNLAHARYFLDPGDDGVGVKVAGILVDLAEQLPDQALAETAIDRAITGLLFPMHIRPQRPPGVSEMYERAMKVLLTKYPTTETADNQRFYYANSVLVPAQRYAEAVSALRAVHNAHADYYPAQRLLVETDQVIFRAAKEREERKKLGNAVVMDATRVRDEAERDMGAAAGDRLVAVRQAAGWSRLILADMAVELDPATNEKEADANIEKALKYLDGFDRDFNADPELISMMLERRIVFHFKVDKLADATAEAKRMMDAFPDQAAGVINAVLTDVDRQIEDLNGRAANPVIADFDRKRLLELAQKKSVAETELATLLRTWAADPKRGKDAEGLLPFDLILARAKLNTGDAKGALEIIEPLMGKFPQNGELINAVGEARFIIAKELIKTDKAQGTAMMNDKVAPLFNSIITGVPAENGKYPDIWWNAWMRRLQISDLVQHGLEDIPLKVRQLEGVDTNLGGDRYKTELSRLRAKYAGLEATVAAPPPPKTDKPKNP